MGLREILIYFNNEEDLSMLVGGREGKSRKREKEQA